MGITSDYFLQNYAAISQPGLIACVIINGLWSWNNLMWPLIVNTSMDKMTRSDWPAAWRSGVEYPVLL